MGAIRSTWLFIYFRGVADPALRTPIGLAGLVTLAVDRTWPSAAVCAIAVITSYVIPSELLFRDAFRAKREVLDFLKIYRGANFLRIPAEELAQYFDLTFLIPSFLGKGWLSTRIARRMRVFTVKSGVGGEWAPASPRAYVSAVALDSYVFLRDSLAEMRPEVHFRLAHELGHASGIYTAIAQRNLIGLVCVYLSIAWAAVNANWSWWFGGWTLVQLLACVIVAGSFEEFRRQAHFHAELAADYMAARHLAPDEVDALLETGLAHALVQADPGLDAAQTQVRKQVLVDHLEARGRGEAVDIPSAYMGYSFDHPLTLKLFVFLHLAYMMVFAYTNRPSIAISAAFVAPIFIYFVLSVWQDAKAGALINDILGFEGGLTQEGVA